MRSTRGAVLVAVALLAAACGVGTRTLRIADAEAEIVRISEAVIEAAGLDVAGPVTSFPLEPCTLRSGGEGLRTRIAVRAPLDGSAGPLSSAFDAAASVMIEQGLVLVESGVPGTLLGQRDGVTVTVGGDADMFEVDAITGCRPR
jgi:hypothetical protein